MDKYKFKIHLAGMDGMKFLRQQMYRYKRYSIGLPYLGMAVQEFLADTIFIGAGLLLATVLNLVSHNEIEKCSRTFLYRRLNALWEEKMLRLDFPLFVSRKGKIGESQGSHQQPQLGRGGIPEEGDSAAGGGSGPGRVRHHCGDAEAVASSVPGRILPDRTGARNLDRGEKAGLQGGAARKACGRPRISAFSP